MIASFSILQEENATAANGIGKLQKNPRKALGDISLNSALNNTPMPLKGMNLGKSTVLKAASTAVKFKIEDDYLDPRDMLCLGSTVSKEDPYDIAVKNHKSIMKGNFLL